MYSAILSFSSSFIIMNWQNKKNSLELIFIDKKFGQFDHQIVQWNMITIKKKTALSF